MTVYNLRRWLAAAAFALATPFDLLQQGCCWVSDGPDLHWATRDQLLRRLVELERWREGDPLPHTRWHLAWQWLGEALAWPGQPFIRLGWAILPAGADPLF